MTKTLQTGIGLPAPSQRGAGRPMLFAPSRSTRAFFFHRPKSEETDRQERSPGDMAEGRLVRFSTMKHKPPHGAHRAAGPRSKKTVQSQFTSFPHPAGQEGGMGKTDKSFRPCPVRWPRKRTSAMRKTGKHFAANTRVLCGKYSRTLRKVRRRPPHAASAGNGSHRRALRKAEPPGHANVEKGRRQER